MLREIFIFAFLWLTLSLQEIHEVIIIGAGISGLSASWELTKHHVPHLILQGRDRIGGRIASGVFENMIFDVGASFVHKPNTSHPIVQLMKGINWTALSARYDQEIYYYEGEGAISESVQDVNYVFNNMIDSHIRLKSKLSGFDMSVKEAAEGFLNHIISSEKDVYRDLSQWYLRLYGNVEGDEIDKISARQYQKDQSSYDMLPAGGYWRMMQDLFSRCNATLKLSHKVTKVNYFQDVVKIQTTQGIYYARKVISSLPLGVLQKGSVMFEPPLTPPYSTAIFNMGSGSQNKLYVSFQRPFWNTNITWINFVRKNKKRSDFSDAMSIVQQGKYILLFFIAGKDNNNVDNLSEPELKVKLVQFFKLFTTKEVIINNILLTKWHLDQFSLGSYTYYKVGASRHNIQAFRRPLRNKIWFVGEHTHPDYKSLTHAAYLTGKQAAEDIINPERVRINMKAFE